MTRKTVIFDIDGTLANNDHRRKYLEGDKPDWGSYNHPDNMIQDLPNMPVLNLLVALMEATDILTNEPKYRIIFVTGRMESSRWITMKWILDNMPIVRNGAAKVEKILMRKEGDYRADHIVKEEILKQLLDDGHDIAFTVDDRKQVVDMWRRNNITCLQVAEGNF